MGNLNDRGQGTLYFNFVGIVQDVCVDLTIEFGAARHVWGVSIDRKFEDLNFTGISYSLQNKAVLRGKLMLDYVSGRCPLFHGLFHIVVHHFTWYDCALAIDSMHCHAVIFIMSHLGNLACQWRCPAPCFPDISAGSSLNADRAPIPPFHMLRVRFGNLMWRTFQKEKP